MSDAVQSPEVAHCCFGSIAVVGALTHRSLLHYLCNLKAAQINVQRSLIKEHMLYKFELDDDTVKAIKNICGSKEERWRRN